MTYREKLADSTLTANGGSGVSRDGSSTGSGGSGVRSCPIDYYPTIATQPEYCKAGDDENCTKCWDREVEVPHTKVKYPDTDSPKILDSGDRTVFASGAVRDMREGKGRCDLLPLDVVARVIGGSILDADIIIGSIMVFMHTGGIHNLYAALDYFTEAYFNHSSETMCLEVAKHFEEGAKKYGDNNWQKGIPVRCYIDSAIRHYLKFRRGDKDEPHDRAFCWNIMCAIWTCIHKPELNDYAGGDDVQESEN